MIQYRSLPKFDDNSYAHFITTNTYKRYPFFRDQRLSQILLEELGFYSGRLGFTLVGYVIMPDHVHLLLWWSRDDKQLLDISKIMQVIKRATARRIIDLLRGRSEHLLRPIAIRREQMLSPTRENISPQYHIRSPKFRLWQPGFYDFNIFSDEKLLEKLDYIHNNPVSAGLVLSPHDYEWSSYKEYFDEEVHSILGIG